MKKNEIKKIYLTNWIEGRATMTAVLSAMVFLIGMFNVPHLLIVTIIGVLWICLGISTLATIYQFGKLAGFEKKAAR